MTDAAPQFGLGVKTSIYNHEMRSRREKMGLSQAQLAALVDMPIQSIGTIETFKWYPSYERLEDIAVALQTTVDVLFPEWLREQRVKKSSYDQVVMVDKIALNAPEMNLLEAPDDIAEVAENHLLHKAISGALESLTEREQKIIRMRFALDGYEPHTLEDVAKEFGVTRERIRSIEAKALAKLRKSKNNDVLADFISLKDGDRIREKRTAAKGSRK